MKKYRVTLTAAERDELEGLQAALSPYRVGQRLYQRKLDGEQEAKLIALACFTPPVERGRWTLRLLAGRMVELQHVDRSRTRPCDRH